MNQLPPELINNILYFLDNKSFGNCYKASKLFHVSSSIGYHRRKYKIILHNLVKIIKEKQHEKLEQFYRHYNMMRIMSGMSIVSYSN